MRVRAIDLATRIAEVYAGTIAFEGETAARLATALYEGVGMVRQGKYCIVVLGSPLDPKFDVTHRKPLPPELPGACSYRKLAIQAIIC